MSAWGRKHTSWLESNRLASAKGLTAEAQVVHLVWLLNLKRDLTNPANPDEIASGMEVLIRVSFDYLQRGDEAIDIFGR
jgi:hypothetical protein